jgi:hypothetical protein
MGKIDGSSFRGQVLQWELGSLTKLSTGERLKLPLPSPNGIHHGSDRAPCPDYVSAEQDQDQSQSRGAFFFKSQARIEPL